MECCGPRYGRASGVAQRVLELTKYRWGWGILKKPHRCQGSQVARWGWAMRGSGQRCNVGGEGPHTGVALLVRSLRQEELVRNVPDDVITMSHRNVHPHVSIHEVALLPTPKSEH